MKSLILYTGNIEHENYTSVLPYIIITLCVLVYTIITKFIDTDV